MFKSEETNKVPIGKFLAVIKIFVQFPSLTKCVFHDLNYIHIVIKQIYLTYVRKDSALTKEYPNSTFT